MKIIRTGKLRDNNIAVATKQKRKIFFTNRFRVPATAVLLVVFVLLAFVARYPGNAVQVNAGASGRQVIVLDAGHGGADSGCVGINGELEKDINLAIVQNLRQLLEIAGFDVVLTRETDESIHDANAEGLRAQKVSDMNNRKTIIDRYPNSIFISVHQNKFTKSASFGAQMFYTDNNPVNMKLAEIMQRTFREYLDAANDREVKTIDDGLYLFKDTKQPALLIECGFLSNEKDAANLANGEYQKKVAVAILSGLLECINTNQT